MEVYVMDVDGTDQTRLTNSSGTDGDPAWSPDGSKILFHSDRDGTVQIYVMNADGSDVTKIDLGSGRNFQPAWLPGS